jgi:general secretion pathway protein G
MRLPPTPVRRPGFTLVELLVVIAIIAVLVALLSGAVLKSLAQGPRLQTRSDLTQLSDAVGTFQAKFNLRYPPPSQLKLCSLKSQYGTTQLDKDSIAYLQSMFPRMADTWSGTINNSFGNANGIMWGPNNTAVNGVVLTGDQCLVFFLGGIQTTAGSTNGCLGFSTNPTDPAAAGGDRIGPFYDFKLNRLAAGASGFFSYNDVWGSPFLYFSSYKTRNGYNRYGGSDCSQSSPYQQPNGIYYNSDTFQIVSAGADKAFGGGGTWDMQSASPVTAAGMDDLTNFYPGLMGVPAN